MSNQRRLVELIDALPLRTLAKLDIHMKLQRFYWRLKYNKNTFSNMMEQATLFLSNQYYGHEYWLKKYAGYNDHIYGLIEHGIEFSECPWIMGNQIEQKAGCIITYGEHRKKILEKKYPDYEILKVGPYLHYASTDLEYKNEILSKIDSSKKTMVLYPPHSLKSTKAAYNIEEFAQNARELARSLNCGNILVSLHVGDIHHKLDEEYAGMGIAAVTAGAGNSNFLPRLRAILEVTDVTVSNAIGTHIGYSVYMGTPHVFLPQEIDYISPELLLWLDGYPYDQYSEVITQVTSQFAEAFSLDKGGAITSEQTELCDHYWGFSSVMDSKTLNLRLTECKSFLQSKKGGFLR